METKVRYLVDTNVWLKRLLDQDKSEVVSRFLDTISLEQIYISDFALHSIGVILSRFKRFEILERFIKDIFFNGRIAQVTLSPYDLIDVISSMERYGLDFDDSYQLSVSIKYDMIIVTFDKDFDIEGIRKISPEQILEK